MRIVYVSEADLGAVGFRILYLALVPATESGLHLRRANEQSSPGAEGERLLRGLW